MMCVDDDQQMQICILPFPAKVIPNTSWCDAIYANVFKEWDKHA